MSTPMQSTVSAKSASHPTSHHSANPIANTSSKPTRPTTTSSKVNNNYTGGDPFTDGVAPTSTPAPPDSAPAIRSAKQPVFEPKRYHAVWDTDNNKPKLKHTAIRNPNEKILPNRRLSRENTHPAFPQLRSKLAPPPSDTYGRPLVKPTIPVTRARVKDPPPTASRHAADVIDIDNTNSPPARRHSLSRSCTHGLSPSSPVPVPDPRRTSLPTHPSRPTEGPIPNAPKRHPDRNDTTDADFARVKIPRITSGTPASQPGNTPAQNSNAVRTQRQNVFNGPRSGALSARSSRMYRPPAVPLCPSPQKCTPGAPAVLLSKAVEQADGDNDNVSPVQAASPEHVQVASKRPRGSPSSDPPVVDLDDFDYHDDPPVNSRSMLGGSDGAGGAGAIVNLSCSPNPTPKKKQKLEMWMSIKSDDGFNRDALCSAISNHPHLLPFAFFGLTDSDLRKLMENQIDCEKGFERQLDLNNNRINRITDHICDRFAEYNLCKLNLSHNKLVDLPEAISACKRLRSLSVSGNGLKKLPETVGNLLQLEVLDLSRNVLESLPDGLGRLSRLKIFCLSYNRLFCLPDDLADKGSSMFALDISHNQSLSCLPKCARHWTELVNLEMDNTALKEVLISKDLDENPAVLVSSIAGRSGTELKHRKEKGKFPVPN